jgi:hypothetical protein
MIAMRVMQASAHEVIDVIPMRHGFVPAGRTMLVRAARLQRAVHGIRRIDRDDMLVDMILVYVVEMPVVPVVDMALMAYRRMPAVGTMLVGMVGVMLRGVGGHRVFSFCGSETGGHHFSAACSMALPTKRRTESTPLSSAK